MIGRTGLGYPVLMATPHMEYTSFAPLVTSTLRAVSSLDDATFRANMHTFFPLLTQLIRADYAPPDVHKALSDLFDGRVGPLVAAAVAGGAGMGGGLESGQQGPMEVGRGPGQPKQL